jgi:hypothetical protein
MLILDTRDEGEQIYLAAFMQMASKHGVSIRYSLDRAALDLGLHLTAPFEPGKKSVTSSRVWFQFKGIGQGKNGLSKEKFDEITDISQSVKIEHLRQWYRYAEPVYLTVYVEAIDKFFAVDVHNLVDERWGDNVFKDETFTDDKGKLAESVTIYLPKTAEVDESFWKGLSKHRSMRIDGATYQGRPLGHSHDIQARVPRIMEPVLFDDVIGQLLTMHRYRLYAVGDAYPLYPGGRAAGDIASISIGKLFEPFQYDLYMTRELIPDEDGYREDGQTLKVQGLCAVITHSSVKTKPDPSVLKELAKALEAKGIRKVLVFINHYMSSLGEIDGVKAFSCFHAYREGFSESSVHCIPQQLEDLGKTLLLATSVYMDFRERIPWIDEVLDKKIKTGELTIMTPEEYFRRLAERKILNS